MRNRCTLLIPSLFALALVASMLLAVQPLHTQAAPAATTRYVALTGSDTGGCTSPASACQTLQYAANQAAGGDTIRIAAGVYSGVNTQGGLAQVVYLNKSLTLVGGYGAAFSEPPDPQANPTTLDAQGQGRCVAIFGPAEITLEGLRLTGGDAAGLYGDDWNGDAGGGLYAYSANVVIRNSTIYSNTASSQELFHGRGGGIFQWGGSLTLSGSTLEGNLGSPVYFGEGGGIFLYQVQPATLADNLIRSNTGSTRPTLAGGGNGGGVYIEESTATLTGNTITLNTGTTGIGALSYASGGGVYVTASDVSLVENTISNNTASVQKEGWGGGVAILESKATLTDNLIEENTASLSASKDGVGGGVYINWHNAVTLTGNIVQNNVASTGGPGWGGGIFIEESTATLTGNQATGNHASAGSDGSGGGIYIYQADFSMLNNLVAANSANLHGSGMLVTSEWYSETVGRLLHNTFVGNTGSPEGIYVDVVSRIGFTNTIIAGHSGTGIFGTEDTQVTLESTLWDANGSNTGGTGILNTFHDYTGDPAFVAPFSGDYHLSLDSAAIDKGIDAQVATDLDGQPRPNGAAPDLGADEYYPAEVTASAEKIAFPPQWFVSWDAGGGLQSYLAQRYLLQLRHNEPIGLVAAFTDTLPAELAFNSELHTPAMDFTQTPAGLTWRTQQPLTPGRAAQVLLTATSAAVAPLETITNHAEASAGAHHFDLQAVSQVPLFPPVILAPGNGEICRGDLEVTGLAHPNASVKIYENQVERATTTAGASGEFAVPYSSALLGYNNVALTAVACLQGSPGQCSDPSPVVTLTPPQSFVCPQPSTWENDPLTGPLAGQHLVYRFQDENGVFKGDNDIFHFVPPHSDSQVHLYRRSCAEMGTPPGLDEDVWLEIEEEGVVVAVYNPSSVNLPWYHFDVDMELADRTRQVIFTLSCTTPTTQGADLRPSEAYTFTASAAAAFDQDGTIFDVTQGYNPADPGLHAVQGVTVTAMISMPTWGGWVPWPAHLFNGQENPQVTGETGYFAFFTPPGVYYLQVDGGPGYQSWRSPVFEVAGGALHTNVPLTPRPSATNQVVQLGASGPDPAQVTISAGETVRWQQPVDGSLPLLEQARLIDNPLTRLLSALDPLASTLGWDSGMLVPGGAYRRQFTQPGVYAYTDGSGHTGSVVVLGEMTLYLPFTIRGAP